MKNKNHYIVARIVGELKTLHRLWNNQPKQRIRAHRLIERLALIIGVPHTVDPNYRVGLDVLHPNPRDTSCHIGPIIFNNHPSQYRINITRYGSIRITSLEKKSNYTDTTADDLPYLLIHRKF